MDKATDQTGALKRVHRLQKTGMLAVLREENGWSQGDVARHLGLSPSAVSRWEASISRPRAAHAVALLELLDGGD